MVSGYVGQPLANLEMPVDQKEGEPRGAWEKVRKKEEKLTILHLSIRTFDELKIQKVVHLYIFVSIQHNYSYIVHEMEEQ